MEFYGYYRGMVIEAVSHPTNQAAAERYFAKRYTHTTYPLVVVPVAAPQEAHLAAKELSNTPREEVGAPKC